MNIHDATEQAYKNGYANGMKDAIAKNNNVGDKWTPTNADRIRAMSDEELADIVVCPHTGNWDLCRDDCKKCRLEWLKQQAEEGSDNG